MFNKAQSGLIFQIFGGYFKRMKTPMTQKSTSQVGSKLELDHLHKCELELHP